MNIRLPTYLALQRLIGSRCDARYRDFQRLEKLDAVTSSDWKAAKLDVLLRRAVAEIPFYREAIAKPSPSLADFPVLTKETIRTRYFDLMAPAVRAEYEANGGKCPRVYGWLELKTGGSTGVPLATIQQPDFRDINRAARLYEQDLCGFPFGTPYFRLWGSMGDINAMKDSRFHRAMTTLAREHLLNAFRMEDAQMDRYLDRMDRGDIRHLMAYTDAASALARHAKKRGRRIHRLESIMACAGTVTDDIRAELREVFGARVHNKYGSRDAGEMACECDRGGLHELSAAVHLEIVDASDWPCAPGTSGRLLVTCLTNHGFPLIRYEIGDVAAWSGRACPCGRAQPVLERLEGRSVEFVTSANGGYVSPVFIRHIIGVVHNPGFIERFQLEQTNPSAFVLRVETKTLLSEAARAAWWPALERDLKVSLGAAAKLDLQLTDKIPESGSGKFLYVINRVQAFR